MFTFGFSPKEQAKTHADEAAVRFCFLLINHSKEVFGVIRVRDILQSTFSLREIPAKFGSDGFPLLEESNPESLKVVVIGLANELTKVFGTSFAEAALERVVKQMEQSFTEEVLSASVLKIIPAGFLELRKIRTLSKEDLEREVEKKTAELRQVNEHLEEKVEGRTKELKGLLSDQERAAQLLVRRDFELTRANDRLKKLDEVKSNFISVVAHQLRTPLSGIKWTLNLLISGDLGQTSLEQKTFLLKAYESNDRMINLVNDMLGADRIESGKLRYNFQPVQLFDVVDNVLFEILPQANARSLKIVFDERPSDLPKVAADPERIRAVFQNLLDNAVKYSRPSGTILVGMRQSDPDTVLVHIKDDGIGIPKEQQKSIFTRFFRATNAVKAETDGSGLGLYIVKNIVERHSGKVWFESVEGSGVTFFFTVPIYKSDGISTPSMDSSDTVKVE
ncbi:MAG: HAMP domain-containing sensor histidine kinase [bacterium]|nr:HAMP domain-containing sensor histidine kinase [bacterium]